MSEVNTSSNHNTVSKLLDLQAKMVDQTNELRRLNKALVDLLKESQLSCTDEKIRLIQNQAFWTGIGALASGFFSVVQAPFIARTI